ncbi:ankyrin repeat domain-containing protein [Wolbachia endosymbiont of Folsomia candida]|uniref:ankyrin repeat domain-containing protein n=1 Tax=Wolbachia endosymbiont of Folsomia candida TaxID=169402 RepID=UPI0013906553|nr:ankyrin repeat domain-containing protein [Wolbachia endosymbiont of Folsomia candida]
MNNIDSLQALFHLITGSNSKEEILKIIRQRKINIDAQDEKGNSLLHHAAKEGRITEVELLLELGIYTALRDTDGKVALEILLDNIQDVNSKTIEIVQILLECAAIDFEEDCIVDGIDNKLQFGKNFLEYAVVSNDVKFAKLLVKCGAKTGISTKNKQGKNLLIQLIEAEGIDKERIKRDSKSSCESHFSTFDNSFIKLLIERGLDINDRDGCKLTALHQAVSYGFDINTIELLLELGADVNAKDEDGVTPLHIAASLGGDNKELINLLIDYGADINARTTTLGHDAIHVAIKCNNIENIRVLLKRGANIESKDKNQFTLLLTAIDSYLNFYKDMATNGPDVIKYLLSKNADIAAEDINGQTGLFYLARANDLPVTKLLIDKYNGNTKKLINKKSKVGYDAVDVALEQDNKKFISLLISLGADVDGIDLSGGTRLHRAIMDDNACEVELLLSLKASVNAKDNNGNTPLHIAIQEASSPKIVNMLLKKGADINICNLKGIDPIGELCCKMQNPNNKQNKLQNNLNECFMRHIQDQYNKDYLHYFQLSGGIYLTGIAYMLLFVSTLPLVITAIVLFAGAVMLSSCFNQWKSSESHYRKVEHRLQEVTSRAVIATAASFGENEKVDCNQNFECIPDQNFRHPPSKKLEEVEIENISQANIRQIVAG